MMKWSAGLDWFCHELVKQYDVLDKLAEYGFLIPRGIGTKLAWKINYCYEAYYKQKK
jgi:hypothetical protein